MKEKRNIRTVGVLLFIAFLLFFLMKIYFSFSESDGLSYTTNSDYINFFAKKYREKLIVNVTYLSKVRNPISTFDYDKDYCVIIYKIGFSKDMPLEQLLKEEYSSINQTTNIVYAIVNENTFELKYKSGILAPVEHLYLTFGDSSKTIIKNDTIASYYSETNKIAVKYSKSGSEDIFIESKRKNIPFNVLFLKRKKEIYIAFMSVNKDKKVLPQDMLYKLVSGH